MNVKIILAILVLSLASMACGFSIDLPDRPQAGPEVKEAITVAAPDSERDPFIPLIRRGQVDSIPRWKKSRRWNSHL